MNGQRYQEQSWMKQCNLQQASRLDRQVLLVQQWHCDSVCRQHPTTAAWQQLDNSLTTACCSLMTSSDCWTKSSSISYLPQYNIFPCFVRKTFSVLIMLIRVHEESFVLFFFNSFILLDKKPFLIAVFCLISALLAFIVMGNKLVKGNELVH